MELQANDIDDILRDLGVNSSQEAIITSTDITDTSSPGIEMTEEDINSIIENNLTEYDATNAFDEAVNESTATTPVQETIEEIQEEPSQEEENTEDNNDSESYERELIPLNSPTLLVDETTTRFSGAEWFKEIKKSRIILAGIGGIGSNVALQLARMVPANITLYDDDIVEMVNMAGQLYCHGDIGKAKVDAIADMICSYTAMKQVNAIRAKFTPVTEPGDIMICGFDSMVARQIFFNSWSKHIASKSLEERAKCLYIDGRLSMTDLQVLCIRGDDIYNIGRYKTEFLFSDSEADATVCSMKQTTYLACMIGSIMVNLFTNFVANTLNPVIPYDLPFFTEYDAQNVIFKTES